MPYYFHVAGETDIDVRGEKNELLAITPEQALTTLAINPSTAKSGEQIEVFAGETEKEALDKAMQAARHGVPADDKRQFLIFEVTLRKGTRLNPDEHQLLSAKGKVEGTIDSFYVAARNVTLQRVRFDHIDAKAQPLELVATAPAPKTKQPVTPTPTTSDAQPSKIAAAFKSWGRPLAIIGSLAGSFSYSGAPANTLALLAKLGVALPFSPLLAEVAISLAAGIAIYAAGKVALSIGNRAMEAVKYYRKSKQERYNIDCDALKGDVESLEAKNGLSEDLVAKFKGMMEAANAASFDDKGELATNQPANERKSLLTNMKQYLQKRLVAKEEERKTMDDEAKKQSFKFSA